MADDKKEKKGGEENVEVPLSVLTKLQEQMAEQEKKMVDLEAKNAGLEELMATQVSTEGEKVLKKRPNFEPKFRTARIRKYPIAGNHENLGYVVGWTNRGAYEEVDRSGVSPQIVNYMDVIFLGQEKTPEGKIKAEKIKALDLMNLGVQVYCKIIDVKKQNREEPTGEKINVNVWDPQHGLVSTGEEIDGYVIFSDTTYTIEIPGVKEPVVIDEKFCN